jgi:hypothetical protein
MSPWLEMIYMFGAGYTLGQLAAHPRPKNVDELVWVVGMVLGVVLWPIFFVIGIFHYGTSKRWP